MVPRQQSVCTEILVNKDAPNNMCYYDALLDNAIKYFEKEEILIKSGIKYYINDKNLKVKLTWENIKAIESNERKELFWLFRKLIVDTILRELLLKFQISNDKFKIYSVGSTSLSSDYDITLYGKNDDKVNIITEFQKRFKEIFGEDSAVVFDTNIYGKAYISFNPSEEEKEYYNYVSCNNQTFYYVKASSAEDSQLMWGLVKYLRDIRDAFGEHVYNDLFLFMTKKIKGFKHLYNANKTLIYLRNKDSEKINYTSLFEIEDSFINAYEDKLLGLNEYISLTNFYGIETYFTRGAFLDTVVNGQMCKTDTVILSSVDYISSILENAGFFFLHNNKTKYFIRVYNSILKLVKNFPEFTDIEKTIHFIKFKNIIEGLRTKKDGKDEYDTRYCKWVGDDDFDFLYCEKFSLFNILFKLIYTLLSLYNTHHPNISNDGYTFPFYFNYVIKSTSELGSPTSITPILEFNKIPGCQVELPTMKHSQSLSTLVRK